MNGQIPFGKFPVTNEMLCQELQVLRLGLGGIIMTDDACMLRRNDSDGCRENRQRKWEQTVMLAAGGGVHGHPDGSEAGANDAFRLWMRLWKIIPVTEYARVHVELARMSGFPES